MTRILPALFLLLIMQPAFAQRAYNKTSGDPQHVYMVTVEGGSFDLGSNDESEDRKPAHTVTLKSFQMGAYEVTQSQWRTVMGSNPSDYRRDDCPVTNVSWNNIQEFIKKLNANTGRHYRLPTEAEWEYAARGGNTEVLERKHINALNGRPNDHSAEGGDRVADKTKEGKLYAGEELPGEIAWFDRNSRGHIHRTGLKHPNKLGLYDMSGNVEEWCSDFYAKSYGSKAATDNPQGPASGISHVVRGGSYESDRNDLAVTRRAAYLPGTKSASLGFRLAEDK